MFEGPVTPFAGGHYHRHSVSRQRTPRTSLSSRDEDPFDHLALSSVSQQDDRLRSHLAAPPRTVDLTEGPRGVDDGNRNRYHDAPNGSYFHPQDRSLDTTHGRYLDDPYSPSSTTASILRTPATSTLSDGDTESQVYIPLTRWQRVIGVLGQVTYTLLPSLHHFRSQSILAQIASIFAAPAVMFLTLTLPVVVTPYESAGTSREKMFNGDGRLVDFEEEGEERVLIAEEEVLEDMHEMSFNKWLTAVQCVVAPVFCVVVLFSSCLSSPQSILQFQSCVCIDGTRYQVPLIIAAGIGGTATAVLVALFADMGNHPASKMARCSMGFFVAIVWIVAIADEVVNVLQVCTFVRTH